MSRTRLGVTLFAAFAFAFALALGVLGPASARTQAGRKYGDTLVVGVTPFMAFEPDVRCVIYTTNAIEALNRQLRKAIKTKGSFPSEDAARKLVYLAIQNAVPQWTRTRGWTKALLAFKIHFGDRLPD